VPGLEHYIHPCLKITPMPTRMKKNEVETKQQWKKVTLDAPKNQALGALDYKKSRNSLNPSI